MNHPKPTSIVPPWLRPRMPSRWSLIAMTWRSLSWRARLLVLVACFPWSLVGGVAWVMFGPAPTLAPVCDLPPAQVYEIHCSPAMLGDWVCVYDDHVVQAPVRGWQ